MTNRFTENARRVLSDAARTAGRKAERKAARQAPARPEADAAAPSEAEAAHPRAEAAPRGNAAQEAGARQTRTEAVCVVPAGILDVLYPAVGNSFRNILYFLPQCGGKRRALRRFDQTDRKKIRPLRCGRGQSRLWFVRTGVCSGNAARPYAHRRRHIADDRHTRNRRHARLHGRVVARVHQRHAGTAGCARRVQKRRLLPARRGGDGLYAPVFQHL